MACTPRFLTKHGHRPFQVRRGAFTAMLAAALLPSPLAAADWEISLGLGNAWTAGSDLTLDQPGGTHLHFDDVSWDDRSRETPRYYTLRITRWFERHPAWALSLDFTHAKVYLQDDANVEVSGRRAGVPVSGRERVDDTIQHLALSHGMNLVTVEVLRRWIPDGSGPWTSADASAREREGTAVARRGRWQLYTGGGLGAAITHVESSIARIETDEYQLGGPTVQGVAGARIRLVGWLQGLVEYKLSYVDADLESREGDRISTGLLTHHLVLGLGAEF